MNKDILKDLHQYFSILNTYQEKLNEDLVMTFDRGYWWCTSDKILQKFEGSFLTFCKRNNCIENFNNIRKSSEKNILYTHLLGWSVDHTQSGELLEKLSISKNHKIANAALRALFPKTVTGLYKLKKDVVHIALNSRSLDVKNKILGILANLPKKETNRLLTSANSKYIHKLTKHRDKARIAILAQIVSTKLKT